MSGGTDSDVLWGGAEAHSRADLLASLVRPPRFDAIEAVYPTGYLPPLITPAALAGLSIAGTPEDGSNQLDGGEGADWLFGGGGTDALNGAGGNDYLDAGDGDDAVQAGAGDDVALGGFGSDVLRGDLGIDQLYGDDSRDSGTGHGADQLFGDGGDASGNQAGQRLFGGGGKDLLQAFSLTDNAVVEGLLTGDQLFGGNENDTLYGNLRGEVLHGGDGNDNLRGDWLAGPLYRPNPNPATSGGRDTLVGGFGEDHLFSGGNDDRLYGGPDSDLLDGQSGNDQLYGGSGIDFMFLSIVVSDQDRLDGHGENEPGSFSPDDQATDILQINGTAGNDTILLSETGPASRRDLRIDYNGTPLTAIWRNNSGQPLLEQFRIDGLNGIDTIGFRTGANAVDVSALMNRSNDFIGVLTGGPGNDTLTGTAGRDRLDGGEGSDRLSGFGGDDRLFGDNGNGQPGDNDILFGGQGNDDLIGGSGTNELFAWSRDPRPGGQFGVFVDAAGNLFDNDGGGIYTLEDTGLNRVLGSAKNDLLYAGTGLDFLYGNGGSDQMFNKDGTPFDALDGGLGEAAWIQYARSTDKVWYVGGTNLDDVISVDFVTEPGLLADHHLVTRLTNNNGTFTFAAQVRLDFNARDDNGNLVWDPSDLLADLDALANEDAATRQLKFDEIVLNGGLLPPEGDFLAIIIDALNGNDVINVGPTVQATVWVDAGPGDDVVEIAPGRAILIDQTERPRRNDQAVRAFDLATAIGNLAGSSLTSSRLFSGLTIDSPGDVDWYRAAFSTTSGASLSLSSLGAADSLSLQIYGLHTSGIEISENTFIAPLLTVRDQGDTGTQNNGTRGTASVLNALTALKRVTGLTLHTGNDVDFYRFALSESDLIGAARIVLNPLSLGSGFTLALFNSLTGTALTGRISTEGSLVLADLAGLPAGEYWLRVTGNRAGRYELAPNFGVAGSTELDFAVSTSSTLNLSTLTPETSYWIEVTSPNQVPTIYSLQANLPGSSPTETSLAARLNMIRQDVLMGSAGNDTLIGGAGEDWIFGGPGNDVLSGGLDLQAEDLIFGNDGDDTFQILPDALPRILGTLTDRFDGGAGNDRVLFLGGDFDRTGDPVPDHVAIAYNSRLHRYEIAALVWDVAQGEFATVASPAILVGNTSLPVDGVLSGNVSLTLTVNGGTGVVVNLLAVATANNNGPADLVANLNDSLVAAGLGNQVVASLSGERLMLTTIRAGTSAALSVTDVTPPGALGLTAGIFTVGSRSELLRHFAFYRTFNVERTVFNTRAGTDEVHGNPNYRFPGFTDTWGIDDGDFQQGATIARLEIFGGDGGDLLFGGPLADYIDGGSGDDFIFGGWGDDVLIGGGGTDFITGRDAEFYPDRFENVSRGSASGLNNDAAFAATLPPIGPGTVIQNLTLHLGDSGDWYQIRTPDALRRFGNTQAARLLLEQITVTFEDPTQNALFQSAASKLFLFPGITTTASDGSTTLVPVERFFGVPEFYLLHVINVRPINGQAPGSPRPAMGSYQIAFSADLGKTTELSADDTNFSVDSTDAADQAMVIPLGDINGDGLADFIGATNDSFGNSSELETHPGHPADFLPPSFARIYFGTTASGDVTLGAGGLVLRTPAPISLPSLFGASWTVFASPGDVNGDGIDDIVATVAVFLEHDSGTTPAVQGTYVVFGRRNWSGTVDLVANANVRITGFTGKSLADVVGDVTGDGIDDLLLGDAPLSDPVNSTAAGAYLFNGRSNWGTGALTLAQATAAFRVPDTNDRLGGGLGGLGDFNGDGRKDFFITDTAARGGLYRVYVFYGRTAGNPFPSTINPDTSASFTITHIGLMTGIPAGNLNANRLGASPDLADDLVVFAHPINEFQEVDYELAGQYFVVPGGNLGGTRALTSFTSAGSLLAPPVDLIWGLPAHYRAGDVDGDGFDDFTFSVREFALSEADDDILHHQVGALYRGGPGFINLTTPDLIMEPAQTVYATRGGADIGFVVVLPPRTAAVGDVNGDGRPDFAQADIDNGAAHVFLGRALTAPVKDSASASEFYQYGTAAPSSEMSNQPGEPVFTGGSKPITGATVLEGRITNEMLAHSISVGDVNGDGREDFLLWGASGGFLLFGPVRINASGDVVDLATVIFDSSFGAPADNQGDLNGDGLGDLVFMRENTPLLQLSFYVVFGRPHANWNGRFTAANADRQFTLTRPSFGSTLRVAVSVLNFNGDAFRDLLVVLPSETQNGERGWLFSGQAITNVFPTTPPNPASPGASALWTLLPDAYTATDLAKALYGPAARGFTNIDLRSTKVVGDTNGDGLDDIVFADGLFVWVFGDAPAPGPFGRAYLLHGRPDSALPASRKFILDDPLNTVPTAQRTDVVFQDFLLGDEVHRLGDLNLDGYDDFAIGRSRENAELARGAVVVIYGHATVAGYNLPALGQPLLGNLVLRRAPAATLNGSYFIGGITSNLSTTSGLSLTSGDYDGDGRPDLVIGETERTKVFNAFFTQQVFSGTVSVFRNIANRGADLLFTQADVTLRGEAEFDRLGTLPLTPGLDLDGDGLSELLVGSGGADRRTGTFASRAGRLYVLSRLPSSEFAPPADTLTLTNLSVSGSGDFLVDLATGPAVFGSLAGESDFMLNPGQSERWHRFTTLGDGSRGNLLRLLPGAFNSTTKFLAPLVEESLITSTTPVSRLSSLLVGRGGTADVATILEFDLSPYLGYRNNPELLQEVALRLAYQNSLSVGSTPLQVLVIDAEADGVITTDDATGAATLTQSVSLASITGSGVLQVDVTAAVRQALAAGKTRLGLRLAIPGTTGSFILARSSPDTGLRVTTGQSGVLGDLFAEDGVMVARGESLINLAPLSAGTYFIRVFTSEPVAGSPLPFVIEISPPSFGSTHPATDQDEIRGGDGNDLLFGNDHLDRIFGQSGADYLVAESVEIKDQEGQDATALPVVDERLAGNAPLSLRQAVVIPDVGLRDAIASALDLPVTTSFSGQPRVARPIYDTAIATLRRLDATALGISSLTGLEFATGLEELYISRNSVVDLAPLRITGPATALRGPVNLKTLVLDSNPLTNLTSLATLTQLQALSLDLNRITDLTPLSGLTALQYLSIDQVLSVASQPGIALYDGYGPVFSFPGAGIGANLGQAMAVQGNLILIGAPGEDLGATADVGAVYLIEANSGMLLRRFANPTPAANERFGSSVAFLGDRIVIGSPGETVDLRTQAGAIYIFDGLQSANNVRIPHPSFFGGSARFGQAIAVVGGNVLVGAPNETNVFGQQGGGAHLINPVDGSTIFSLFDPTPAIGEQFGAVVAAFGSDLLITALGERVGNGNGRVYRYDSRGNSRGSFVNPAPPTSTQNDFFGVSLAVVGDNLWIGASQARIGTDVGRVFLFNGLTGASLGDLSANNPSLLAFGVSLAANERYLLVGASAANGGAGAAVLYDAATRQQLRVLSSPLAGARDGGFGWSVGLATHRFIVGESGADFTSLADAGAVHGFEHEGGLVDISPLSALTSLRQLSLRGDQITSVTPLAGLAALTHLNLENNRIASIVPLHVLRPAVLNVARNPLDNSAHTTVLPALAAVVPTLSFTPNPTAPILSPIASQVTPLNTDLTLNFAPTPDVDGHAVFLTFASSNANQVSVIRSGNSITLRPATGFTGIVQITVTLQDGPTVPGDGRGRAVQQTFDLSVGLSAIQGTVWHDLNANGTRDGNEPAISGRTIYLDSNTNGRFDNGEPTAVTDETGRYAFSGRAPGNYTVGQILPSQQWNATAPATSSQVVTLTGITARTDVNFGSVLVVDAGADRTVAEGSTVTLVPTLASLVFGTPPTPAVYTFQWAVTASNGQNVPGGSGNQFSFVPGDNGLYTVTLTLTDTAHGNLRFVDTVLVTATNAAPQSLNLGGNRNVQEGAAVALTAAFTDPGNRDTHSIVWQVSSNNGQTVPNGNGANFSFTPGDNGIYTVTATITDDDGGVAAASVLVTVSNRAPQSLSAGSDRTVAEGTPVTFNGTFTDLGSRDTHTLRWQVAADNGQEIAEGTTQSFGFTPNDNGRYVVTFTVTDDDGASSSASAILTVTNVAPQNVSAGPDFTADEGSLISLAGLFTDPGNDGHQFSWRMTASNGQILPDGTGQNYVFTPRDNGTYTATFTVTDDDGAAVSDTVVVTVRNVAPQQLSAGPDLTVFEGGAVSLTSTFVDPGSDTHTIVWRVSSDNGQTLPNGAGNSYSFAPRDNGIYTVTLTVSDDDGGVASTSIRVTVLNAAPRNLDLGADQEVFEGQNVQLSIGLSDPGTVDTHVVRWSVAASNGQVIAGGAGLDFTFVPVNDGTYVVTATVTDDDGAAASATATITALNRAPAELSLAQQSDPGSALAGQSITFSGSFRDVSGDVVRATIDFGDGTSIPLLFHASPNADVNNDRVVNELDIYLVWQNLLQPPANRDLQFDLNGDAAVTSDDVAIVQASFGLVLAYTDAPSDVNADGLVNDLDLYLVWQNLLKPAASRDLRHDLSGDGAVTIEDVVIVRSSYRLDLSTTLLNHSYSIKHTYIQPGPFTATVTVFDNNGGQASRSIIVQSGAALFAAAVSLAAGEDVSVAPAASESSSVQPVNLGSNSITLQSQPSTFVTNTAGQDVPKTRHVTNNPQLNDMLAIRHNVRAGSMDLMAQTGHPLAFHAGLRFERSGGQFDRTLYEISWKPGTASLEEDERLTLKQQARQSQHISSVALKCLRELPGGNSIKP